MCTLTYLPTKDGYTLTHNRDEREDRPSSEHLKSTEIKEHEVYFPQDLEANGTWMAFSNRNMAVCLMNGGSKTYKPKENYRHSRGLVVLDFFKYDSVPEFYRKYLFKDLEPFTIIARTDEGLWKITHDEGETTIEDLDPTAPQIWSSTTLYTEEVKAKRRKWFEDWLAAKPTLSRQNILKFHQSAGEGDSENDLIMSRWGLLKTLSITQVSVDEETAHLVYQNFVEGSWDEQNVFIQKTSAS